MSAREGGRGARSTGSARCVVPCGCADLRMKVRARGPCRGQSMRARSGGRGREPVSPVCRGRFWLDQVRTVMVGSGSGRDRASWAVRGHVRPDRAEPVVK